MSPLRSRCVVSGLCVAGLLAGFSSIAAGQAIDSTGDDLSTLDIDELARIKVTAVARRPEAMVQSSAAVTVISREDIRRSGAADLPEALRLLPGLAAARGGTRDWAISSRGFNQQSANKMLVLVDGRAVYSPIFAGVFWDVQRVPLETVDRIELVRGPGAVLWGANAVNGVINVVTRPSEESQGTLAGILVGTNDQARALLRYGTGIGSTGAIRFYGMGSTQGGSDLEGGGSDNDDWRLGQTGFRADFRRGPNQTFTIQGDAYAAGGGTRLQLPAPTSPFTELVSQDLTAEGGNLLGRWVRRFSPRSDLSVQSYVDYAAREQPAYYGRIAVTTFDLDFQHHFGLGRRQDVIWGLGYRLIKDDITGGFTASFVPPARTVSLVTGFVQDEIILVPGELSLSLGSKFEHNDYTGFELQPGGRILWNPDLSTTLWGAVSRAVRTPSRVDSDIRLVTQVFDAPPLTTVEVRGSESLEAEELVAYEAGYRMIPHERVSFDIAGFYHEYHQVRSVVPSAPESSAGGDVLPFIVTNDARARILGGTASITLRLNPWWRTRASYTFLDETTGLEDNAPAGAIPEFNPGLDPRHQVGLWSSFDLPGSLELDILGRYVSGLEIELAVEDYLQADLQLGASVGDHLRVALIGRDLFSQRHVEFPQPRVVPQRRAVERQLRGRVSWRF